METQKNPRVCAGERADYSHVNNTPQRRGCQTFLPPRFRSQLPALRYQHDIDLATSIRGLLRRSINQGRAADAGRWACLTADFVKRRAIGGGM